MSNAFDAYFPRPTQSERWYVVFDVTGTISIRWHQPRYIITEVYNLQSGKRSYKHCTIKRRG